MKTIRRFGIVVLILMASFLCFSCSDNSYPRSSGWDVSNEDFMSSYYNHILSVVSEIAQENGVDYSVLTSEDSDNSFTITYYDDNEKIEFYFVNDPSGFGRYYSDYCIFELNQEDLFNYEKYRNSLMFISDVNSIMAYDFQGSERTYYDLYCSYLNDGPNSQYYHYDSIVGNIGYWVTWGDNYSSSETRWYISFKYISLLEKIDINGLSGTTIIESW